MSDTSEESYQLFKTDLCGFCYRVRGFLEQNGIEVPMRDVNHDRAAFRELLQATGRTTVPCLRIQRGRIVINPQHNDFPVMLAVALDCLAAHDWDVRVSAAALDCSATQLVRFLAEAPAALAELNRKRAELGLRPLRR